MRRVVALAFVVVGLLVVAADAFIRYLLRGIPKPVKGVFANGMAYARLGTGPKTMLWIRGGPGNVVPMGRLFLALSVSTLRPFVESGYTCWVVTRKQNMPKGYTVADMAEDYAGLIADEFDGKVDLVAGEEAYGGMIGFCLAARHPDRLGRLATLIAGYQVSEQGKAFELDFARLMSEGRTSEAGALVVGLMAPDLRVPGVARVIGAAFIRLFFGETHPYFASDVMIEAEAVTAFDAREVLSEIPVPVLLIGCDKDPEFSKEVYEETARLIPDCTLRLYRGKTGFQAVMDKRLPQDVLDFVGQRSRVQAGRDVEQATIIDRTARRHIHQDIWIAAPVEEVFALYCDATRWRELAGADMGEITSVSGPIDQVGTTFEGTMRIAGRKISGTMRIAEVEPPRLVRVQNDEGAMGFVYRFEPEGNGTRFSADAEYEMTSPLSRLADKVVLHGYMDRAMRHMTGKMKEMAEAKAPVAT